MTVWPARTLDAARPQPADTLALTSKTTASFVHVSLNAIKDQIIPASSADSSASQLDFYWFDDTGRGACRVPKSWRVLYQESDGQFQPVGTKGPYGTRKDGFNRIEFENVTTSAIKLEIVLQDQWSSGVQEVVVE